MLPFDVEIRPGHSPYKQVVFAATKAVVSGELLPGAPFPSVRTISQSLKINPNTAHKVVADLVRTGLLEVLPGVGTVVAHWQSTAAGDRTALVVDDLDRVLVEGRRLGLTLREVEQAVAERWEALFEGKGVISGSGTGETAATEVTRKKDAS